jgi:predicted aspartyl protease
MGHFHVEADLTGPTGVTERVPLLVDTGATFLAVPRAVADRLGLEPTRVVSIQVAGERRNTGRVRTCGSRSERTR